MKMKFIVFVLFFVVICLSNSLADIYYSDFSSTAGLSLVGNTTSQSGILRLTPSAIRQTGAAWFAAKQQVNMGFETTFDFRISNNTSPAGADGIAFVIQNSSQSAIGQFGGYLGYGKNVDNPSQGGILNSLAIEFDTYGNAAYSDLPSFHISLQSGGTGQNSAEYTYSLGSAMIGYSITDGVTHIAKIKYEANKISVFLDNLQTPRLTVSVNLSTLLDIPDGLAYAGFTSGTGTSYSTHDILNWTFTEVPEPATLSLLGISGLILLRKKK